MGCSSCQKRREQVPQVQVPVKPTLIQPKPIVITQVAAPPQSKPVVQQVRQTALPTIPRLTQPVMVKLGFQPIPIHALRKK